MNMVVFLFIKGKLWNPQFAYCQEGKHHVIVKLSVQSWHEHSELLEDLWSFPNSVCPFSEEITHICFHFPYLCRYKSKVSVHIIPLCHGFISVGRTGSVYLTMAVTLERYFAIVRPLSHFGAKKFLLPATLAFAVVYNIPRWVVVAKILCRLSQNLVLFLWFCISV